jgi:outer membrane cobalamin receptor
MYRHRLLFCGALCHGCASIWDISTIRARDVFMRRRLLYVWLIVAPWAPAAAAQPATPPADSAPPPRFDTTIVVTPERGETPRIAVPAATDVLDRATLDTLPAVHAAEAASFLPGFNVMRSEWYAGRPVISSRGFFGGGEADYVVLLVDGVRVADVESGLIDWSAVSTTSIRRIEAYRGPAASLYGDAAIGGVIQILSDRPKRGGQLTATAGSYDSLTADGTVGRRSDRAGVTASGAARRTDGGFDHSGARELVGGGSADGTANGYAWRWSVSGADRDRDDPGALPLATLRLSPWTSDPMFRFDTVSRRDLSTNVTVGAVDQPWKPQARVYLATRSDDLIRTIPLAPGLGDLRARALASRAIGGSVEAEHAFGARRPAVVRVGVDLAHEHLETSYRSVAADTGAIGALNIEAAGRRLRTGFFASGSWQPSPAIRLSTGVRRDEVDDRGFGTSAASAQQAWSPRAGVAVQLADDGRLTLFGQVSRAFKAPTLDQRFDPRPFPDFRGGTFTISNRSLVPQRATNAEAGMSGAGRVRWSALVYRMTVDDEIDFDLRTFSYANIGRSRHLGAELEAEGRWWRRLRPVATYAWTHVGEIGGDEQLKNVPRHLATAGVSADLPGGIGVTGRYARTWGAFLDDANVYPLEGRSTLEVRARRPIGRHTLFVDVLNATNHVSEAFGFTLADFRGRLVPYAYPDGPRAVRAGVSVAF